MVNKRKESERLNRLYNIMTSVPLPISGGTRTATSSSFVEYALDMGILQNALSAYYLNCMIELNWSKKGLDYILEEFSDYTSPDDALGIIETWIESRKNENWVAQSRVSDTPILKTPV